MLVNRRQSEQSRNGHLGCAQGAVADDENILAGLDGIHGLSAKGGELGFYPFMAPGQWVSDVQRVAFELALRVRFNVAQLLHVSHVQHRLADFQPHWRVDLVDVEQVWLGTDEGHQRHHNRLANRINRWVGDLCKQLLEVVVQRFVFVRQHRQW